MTGQRIVVTGPSRSGKSEWAESLAQQAQQPVIYVATAQSVPSDPEWQARIEDHRRRRPGTWRTIEGPVQLTAVLRTGAAGECWLIDSLGTWLATHLEQADDEWQATVAELIAAIAAFPGTLILVAEETGWGVVPPYPLGRTFRDRLGGLTRQIGTVADHLYLVVAGYAIDLPMVGVPVSQPEDNLS